MEILEVFIKGGTMAFVADDGILDWVRPPRIVRAAGGIILCGGGVSCVAGVSRCAGSARAPPILTLFHRVVGGFQFWLPPAASKKF